MPLTTNQNPNSDAPSGPNWSPFEVNTLPLIDIVHLIERFVFLLAGAISLCSLAIAEVDNSKVMEVAHRVRETVVSVISEREVAILAGTAGQASTLSSAQYTRQPLQIRSKLQRTIASGIVFDDAGHIVTLATALSMGGDYFIKPRGELRRKAVLIGRDLITNIAVLLADISGLTPIESAEHKLRIGEQALAVSNPYGLEGSVALTQVSGLNRFIQSDVRAYSGLIQLTTPLNPGEMGGLVANLKGVPVGMLSFSYEGTSKKALQPNISFAIPFERVQRIASQLINKKRVEHGWLGMTVMQPPDGREGAVVFSVPADSPVKNAIRPNDLIVKVDDQEITHPSWLQALVLSTSPGKEVNLTLLRDEERIQQKVALLKAPENAPLVQVETHPVFFGAAVSGLTNQLRVSLGYNQKGGVVITETVKNSVAARLGLLPGDIVVAVGDEGSISKQRYLSLISSTQFQPGMVFHVFRDGIVHSFKYDLSHSVVPAPPSRSTYKKVP